MKSRMYDAVLAGIIAIGLLIVLAYSLLPFIGSFFGAIILYVLLKPGHRYVTKKLHWNKRVSAIFFIVLSILVVILPIVLLIRLVYLQSVEVFIRGDLIESSISQLNELLPQINLEALFSSQIGNIGTYISNLLLGVIQNTITFTIGLVIAYFLVYYMLIEEKFYRKVLGVLPFKEKNSLRLVRELKTITYTTVIVTGILAIMQGILVGIGFYFASIKGFILWGFIAAIISFIPVIGTPFVWGPGVIYKFIQGDSYVALALLLWGLFLSNVDNFIRPYLQDRVGKIHPLTTLLGVFLGINMFGLVGVIIGPLLISYAFIILEMFKEEYIDS